jgi:FtsP/CotA-like multicopper oxidase with cupredoxin domain
MFPRSQTIVLLLLCAAMVTGRAWAQEDVCPRPAAGSQVLQPPELRSQNGRLELTLRFKISEDANGLLRFCYLNESGMQGPTLRVNPGDELIIHFRNELPGSTPAQPAHSMEHDVGHCADAPMSMASTNLHFHGLNVPPKCHQDDVLQTLIGPAGTFDYRLKIPANATPGLYWYHPHPHFFGEVQVQGGASGALIVEGIAAVHPELGGLPERVLVLRDQKLPMSAKRITGRPAPGWDVSLNYVPVLYPDYVPAVLPTAPERKEFWRVLNAAADTIFDLQMIVDDAPQPLRLVAIDGVPLNRPSPVEMDVLIPPGSRAEFVVVTPKLGAHAELVTRAWDTGPDGENDPRRPIAKIVSSNGPHLEKARLLKAADARRMQRYASLKTATPAAERKLYFSEIRDDPNFGAQSFYITVDGQPPTRFKMDAPPNIIVRQGSVEDWTIENRSREEHVFHIHQIHFQVIESDGKPVDDPAIRDTIDLPYWKGKGPYPSVQLRMDFREPNTIGTLMYHCHILQHSANGMMGSVRVVPAADATADQTTGRASASR